MIERDDGLQKQSYSSVFVHTWRVTVVLERRKMSSADLRGKICVVTGATKGIGKGIALQLGTARATVYITGKNVRVGHDVTCASFFNPLQLSWWGGSVNFICSCINYYTYTHTQKHTHKSSNFASQGFSINLNLY